MESSMHNPIVLRVRPASTVVATAMASSLAIIVAATTPGHGASTSPLAAIELAQSCTTFGPYATMRRANEIVYQANGLGYSAMAFHNGDGYYVRVC
jgi:hypothetical protein